MSHKKIDKKKLHKHHLKAAEHHKKAAEHHSEAAKHHEAGEHEKGQASAYLALAHGRHAKDESCEACSHYAGIEVER
ncbi:MAG: hypothetical protein CK424_06600 [Legionella sp.]|nr:MAG: hypothetical protein CK424_06600 [Legionella sp.]